MKTFTPELQELQLKMDKRILKEIKQYVNIAHLCGTDMSSLPMQVMLRIVKAFFENQTELKLSFKSDDPDYRGF